MMHVLLEAVELVPELPYEFALGPCEALVVRTDDQDVVVAPAVSFHLLG
jgi:hypothetical protein